MWLADGAKRFVGKFVNTTELMRVRELLLHIPGLHAVLRNMKLFRDPDVFYTRLTN